MTRSCYRGPRLKHDGDEATLGIRAMAFADDVARDRCWHWRDGRLYIGSKMVAIQRPEVPMPSPAIRLYLRELCHGGDIKAMSILARLSEHTEALKCLELLLRRIHPQER